MSLFQMLPNADTEFFYNKCNDKKIMFQQCKKCGFVRWPVSFACPECYSKDYEYITSKGIGKIFSFTVFRTAFHRAFKEKLPYIVAIIEMEEKVKLVSNIVNTPLEKVKCNTSVKVVWEKEGDFFLPKFEVMQVQDS